MQGIMRELRKQGFQVKQKFAVPNHQYRTAQGLFSKLCVRIKAYILYPAMLAWQIVFREKEQAINVVCTNTFYAPLLAAICSRKKPVIHLLYDVYPDALECAGYLKPHSALSRFIAAVTHRTLHVCDANVLLGKHLKKHVENRYGEVRTPWVIPVGADDSLFTKFQKRTECERIEFLYCGHLGRMHNTQTLSTALLAQDREWLLRSHFRFYASGPNYEPLQKQLHLLTQNQTALLDFGYSIPDEDWLDIMEEADVGIVTMAPGAEKIVMPSKAYSAIAAGQAILAICPRDSDLADLVNAHDCGWVVEPGDIERLRETIAEIVNDKKQLLRKRRNAWQAGHGEYSSKALAQKWRNLFEQVLSHSTTLL